MRELLHLPPSDQQLVDITRAGLPWGGFFFRGSAESGASMSWLQVMQERRGVMIRRTGMRACQEEVDDFLEQQIKGGVEARVRRTAMVMATSKRPGGHRNDSVDPMGAGLSAGEHFFASSTGHASRQVV